MTMRISVALFVLSLSCSAFAGGKDPDWMVKIITRTANGEVSGGGFIVQIGSKQFVRTASHVTLGGEAVSMTTGSGQNLVVIPNAGIIDTLNDDQLIRIENTNIAPIGTYSPQLKSFVVRGSVFNALEKSKSLRLIERRFADTFYVVPSWTKGLHSRKKVATNPFAPVSPYHKPLKELLQSFDGNTLYTNTPIIPGESGLPLFTTIPAGYSFTDMDGSPIESNLRNSQGFAAVIYGHVQGYLRYFSQTSFSAPIHSKNIVEEYLKKPGRSLHPAIWRLRDGITYRELKTPQGLIQETIFSEGHAGNGTGGDGGNGTGGDGGNGTGGDGGKSRASDAVKDLQTGMIYNGHPILAFKVEDRRMRVRSYVLAANWDSLRYVQPRAEELKEFSFTPVAREYGLNRLILDKIDASNENSMDSTIRHFDGGACSIDRHKLYYGELYIKLKHARPVTVNLRDAKVSMVHRTSHYSDQQNYTIDISGLFSLDISEVTGDKSIYEKSEFEYFAERLFVTIGSENSVPVKVPCEAYEKITE